MDTEIKNVNLQVEDKKSNKKVLLICIGIALLLVSALLDYIPTQYLNDTIALIIFIFILLIRVIGAILIIVGSILCKVSTTKQIVKQEVKNHKKSV